jgi:hypothetical protein
MNARPRNRGSDTGMPARDAVVTLTLALTESSPNSWG